MNTSSNKTNNAIPTHYNTSKLFTLKSLALAISNSDGKTAWNVVSIEITGLLNSVSQRPFAKCGKVCKEQGQWV